MRWVEAYLRDPVVQRKGFRAVCIVNGVCMQIYGRYRRNGLDGRGVWSWGSVCQVVGGARYYDGVGNGVGDRISEARGVRSSKIRFPRISPCSL